MSIGNVPSVIVDRTLRKCYCTDLVGYLEGPGNRNVVIGVYMSQCGFDRPQAVNAFDNLLENAGDLLGIDPASSFSVSKTGVKHTHTKKFRG